MKQQEDELIEWLIQQWFDETRDEDEIWAELLDNDKYPRFNY